MSGKRTWTIALLVLLGTAWRAPAQQPNPKPPEPPPGTKAYRDLAYVTDGHDRNKLDLYVPEKAAGALPLIVWIHGGGWQNGSKERCPALPLVAKGYAVASINYRLSQHAVYPAQIDPSEVTEDLKGSGDRVPTAKVKPRERPHSEVPPKYGNTDTSGLTYTVKKGENEYSVDLTP